MKRPASLEMSGNATSMIGLCQEGKSSPDALGRSAGVNSLGFFAACLGFSARGFFVFEEPDFHLLAQPFQLTRRLSLCSPASLETNPWEYPELALLYPVALPARPGRRRVEEFLLIHRRALRSDRVAGFRYPEIPLSPIDGHQIGHQLSGNRQRSAIGIAFLFFLVLEQSQRRTVARGHLGRLNQRRL